MSTVTDNVDLAGALDSAPTAEKKKTRNRKSKLPQPALEDGKRLYEGVLDINPETHSLPPEAKFRDPLHYWQTRVSYANNVMTFAQSRVTELEAQTPEQREEKRKAATRAAQVQRAVNNDAVKQAIAEDPTVLLEGLSPEQIQGMLAQFNAMLAEKSVE